LISMLYLSLLKLTLENCVRLKTSYKHLVFDYCLFLL
jgi:hypothetical protein